MQNNREDEEFRRIILAFTYALLAGVTFWALLIASIWHIVS